MRALLITTSADLQDPPLRPITEILRRANVEPVMSGALGAGSYLREQLRSHDDINLGIVILPYRFATRGGLALMVEAGICLGLDIPLLAIIHPDEKLPPALSSIRHVSVSLDNTDALQLHLGMFIQSAASLKAWRRTSSPQLTPRLTSNAPRGDGGKGPHGGSGLVERIAALLRSTGKDLVLGDLDSGADMAFVAGDDSPFVVVVEAKKTAGPTMAHAAADQLQEYVDRSGAGLGLLVTDEAISDFNPSGSHPEVLLLSLTALADIVASGEFDKFVRSVRNRIAHQG
ncbi:hypothetical protein [Micromonospora sp. DH14]|uniref:hypothetical protein n=1 Tax=Micromonospora sp. DH14 TaxID=3040120 RepID=UPI00244316DD|nr:hypothetical protein [Micromonospora sp. DH14]MDG9674821.1 hypothetical protein [Micromonospora sp. DH14]